MNGRQRFRAAGMAAVVLASLAGCAEFPLPGPASVEGDDTARLADMLARCQQLQREDRRKLEQTAHQLREERRRNEAMQQKIEALREIDREMMQNRKAP